jgi:hypothetical protein
MKKLLLGLVLGASVAMASDVPTDDLLAVATQGKTAGSQFEMSKSEMKKADGGYRYTYDYSRRQWVRTYNSYTYKNRPFTTYYNTSSRGTVHYASGNVGSTYYRRNYNSGRTSNWSSYNYGGYSWMAY